MNLIKCDQCGLLKPNVMPIPIDAVECDNYSTRYKWVCQPHCDKKAEPPENIRCFNCGEMIYLVADPYEYSPYIWVHESNDKELCERTGLRKGIE